MSYFQVQPKFFFEEILPEYSKLVVNGVYSKISYDVWTKLKNIEKDIPAPVLAAYKRLRTQRKLPAFVEYKGDGSCFCGMNLPNDCIGKLKTDGDFVECPNCGRIVILNK